MATPLKKTAEVSRSSPAGKDDVAAVVVEVLSPFVLFALI